MRAKYRNLFLGLLLIVLCIGIFFAKNPPLSQGKKAYTITLTEEGFQPAKISIHRGDTVLFKTTRKELFWPASNLHPTHELYSEFDPKRPIDSKDTWSFTFEKVGTWGFHDHLFPYFRGEIKVVD